MRLRQLPGLLLLFPASAFAHADEALQPHDLWTAWSFEPGVVIPLVMTALLYALGARHSRGISSRQMLFFWSGWLFLTLSLISPLHPLGEVLFSAHMAQHEILMLIAAPLLVLARPLVASLWGLPLAWRRSLGQWSRRSAVWRGWKVLTNPLGACALQAVALFLWHAPVLFQATLTNDLVHAAQHLTFLLTALLFWWSLLYGRDSATYGASLIYLFTTALYTSILGALLTFSGTVWYPAYSATTAAWGLTPLEDQQVGGLIMWIPAGLVYLGAGLWVFASWLRQSDALAEGREFAR